MEELSRPLFHQCGIITTGIINYSVVPQSSGRVALKILREPGVS